MSGMWERAALRGSVLAGETAIAAAIHAVSDVNGVKPEALRSAPRAQDVTHKRPEALARSRARQEAVYCAVVVLGRSRRAVARRLGMQRQLVDRYVAAVEEAREDPATDRRIDEIELALMGGA